MEDKKKYDWKFANIGGVPRVRIETGDDIAHLSELDQKLWTVLSCPVKGLEISEKTLSLLDTDGDGKIRVNEIISNSQWLTSILKDSNLLLNQSSELNLDDINQETENGKKIYNSAKQILANLGVDKNTITVADTANEIAIFEKTKFNGDGVITENSTDDAALKSIIANCIATIGSVTDRSGAQGINADQIEAFYANCADYAAWVEAGKSSASTMPFADQTETALGAYLAIKDKVDDYFMRCKLAVLNKEISGTLEVSAAQLEAISSKNLAQCNDEISNYPIARISDDKKLQLDAAINPVYEKAFNTLKAIAFVDQTAISEEQWSELGAKFGPYITWKAEKKGATVESLGIDTVKNIIEGDQKSALLNLVSQDKAVENEVNDIKSVNKLMLLYRDFYKLLKNYVTFSDFYSRDENNKAIFQAGTLYIDQRSCDLCIRVADMAAHNASASFSGMYLIYCNCTSKVKNETISIVAVLTNGDVNNLRVGMNAIFYDRNGLDWDAVVTKIVDNPISIRQAFWSPYRKMSRFIEEQVNKFASNQDTKMMNNATAQISEKGTELTEAKTTPLDQSKKEAFDIAKFCGIFAAIGLAIGAIGGFLATIVDGFFGLVWWQQPLAILGLVLIISGPSMIMAWLKLRKRNLSPLLNANGWAINAQAFVNITFGATLTQMAATPIIMLPDPYAKKKTSGWVKLLYFIVFVVAVLVAMYFTGTFAKLGINLPF